MTCEFPFIAFTEVATAMSFPKPAVFHSPGYPLDLQEEAVKTVLAQAELLCAVWV